MPRFASLFAPIRKSLVARDDDLDPFRPLDDLPKRRTKPPALSAPVGPAAPNRPGDVGRVAEALRSAGFLGRAQAGAFDSPLDAGVRDFQRRRGLKVDGLLNPGGPTARALGRALARPPLTGLSGEAASANARLVRHLMTTAADGIVPDLMAADVRSGRAGRAKTADFLSQLFRRDPARARGLRAKARGMLSQAEKGLLDRLILQARLADADDPPDDDVDDPDNPPPRPPEDPEEPPYDPDRPRPGDPDDPDEDDGPDEPDEPEKPDENPCQDIEDVLRELYEDLDAVQEELRKKKGKFDENEARIKELEAERERLEARLSLLLNAQRLAARSGNRAVQLRAAARAAEISRRLAEIQRELEPLKAENEKLKSEIETLEEQERQKRENAAELERRLEECEAGNRKS